MAKLFKKEAEFIDLREKPLKPEVAIQSPSSTKDNPRGPTFYVSNIDLPITDQDIDDIKTVTMKIKPRRVSVTNENGTVRKSFDFEIMGIKF